MQPPDEAPPSGSPTGVAPARPREPLAAAALALTCTLAITAWLFWPLPLHLQSMHAVTDFGDGHVWVFDRIARFVTGQTPLSTQTNEAGFPETLDGRFLGWGPALLALPLRALFGPIAAYNIVYLLTPSFSCLACWLLVREATRCSPWVAATAAVPYGICPYAIGSLTNGQIEKAQIWVYPLYLWLLYRAVRGPGRGLALLGIPVLTLVAVYTCPYFGLVMPFLAVPLAVGLAATQAWRGERLVPALAAATALGLTALATAPAGTYYRTAIPGSGVEVASMFRPADAPCPADGHTQRFQDAPSAQPRETVFGTPPMALHVGATNHITYLILPLLVAGALGALRRGPGQIPGLVVLLVGLTLAAGPVLVADGLYQTRHGQPYLLPDTILERYGYPLRYGGQYYRAIAVASLGLSLLLASGLARLPRRWGFVVGALVCGLCVRDFLQFWKRLTPWPTATLPGLTALPALATNGQPGAVLALPFTGAQTVGSYGLLEATLHRRPTSAVARAVRWVEAPHYAPWATKLPAAAAAGEEGPYLRSLGFGYAVMTLAYVRPQDPDLPELSRATLTTVFGPPLEGDGVLIWDLHERDGGR